MICRYRGTPKGNAEQGVRISRPGLIEGRYARHYRSNYRGMVREVTPTGKAVGIMTRIDAFDPTTWLNALWFGLAVCVVVLVAVAWPLKGDD
jgi:hypothetical protein